MATISEQEFKKLCHDIYRDRYDIYSFNPNVNRGEVVLWMLLGCLLNLLSISTLEQPSIYSETNADTYADAIYEVLQHRMQPAFEPRVYIEELSARIEAE